MSSSSFQENEAVQPTSLGTGTGAGDFESHCALKDEGPTSSYQMVNRGDDIVEVLPRSPRRAVSSGEPSLDGSGSGDDERSRPASDTELPRVDMTTRLAQQVRGPSSDALESECAKEHMHLSQTADDDHHHDHRPGGSRSTSSDSAELVDASEVEAANGESMAADGEGEGWTNLLGTKQLMKRTVKEGDGPKPQPNQWATIDFEGRLTHPPPTERNKLVDCNTGMRVLVGFRDVIDALDMAVQHMRVGEEAIVKTIPRFAYGSRGRDNSIPPDADLTYTVKLVAVEDGPNFEAMQFEEWNKFLAAQLFEGFDHSSLVADEQEELCRTCSVLYTNAAICYSKMSDWQAVLLVTERAVALESKNAKALYHRGHAYATVQEFDTALSCLDQAIKYDPDSIYIQLERERVLAERKCRSIEEKAMYRRMLRGVSEPVSVWRYRWAWFADHWRYFTIALVFALLAWSVYQLINDIYELQQRR